MKFGIGYRLLGRAEGRGYMGEEVEFLIEEHASRGFHRAGIACQPANTRSRAVARRCGFEYEGTLRHCKWDGEKFPDMQLFAPLMYRSREILPGGWHLTKTLH